jgi:hypothetical protein
MYLALFQANLIAMTIIMAIDSHMQTQREARRTPYGCPNGKNQLLVGKGQPALFTDNRHGYAIQRTVKTP